MSGARVLDASRPPREPWRESLEALGRTPGVAGAMLVAREGACVVNEWPRVHRPETASAMGAALLAAAEVLAREAGLRGRAAFRVEAGGRTILGLPATEEMMVVAVLAPGADPDGTAAEVERLLEEAREATR